LSDPQLRARLDRQLPARAWPRSQWDRADLLVATLYFNDGLAAGRAGARSRAPAPAPRVSNPNPTVTLMSEYANQHDGSPLWLWAVVTDWLLTREQARRAHLARRPERATGRLRSCRAHLEAAQ